MIFKSATTLGVDAKSDNVGCGDLKGEWGLSFHIEFNGKTAGLAVIPKELL